LGKVLQIGGGGGCGGGVAMDVAYFEGHEFVFEDEEVFDHEEVWVCCGGGFGGC
jgi:hypothetical protein